MRHSLLFVLSSVLMVSLACGMAYAQNDANGAKPLTALPAPDAKPKNDPNAFPQMFTDERHKIRDDFNALLKENKDIQAQCDAAKTSLAHSECDRKKQFWQTKMDAIHARTREYHRKVDTWRRKQAGLPPPEWWSQSGQKNDTPSYSRPSGNAQPDNSVLLPKSSTPLPANTF